MITTDSTLSALAHDAASRSATRRLPASERGSEWLDASSTSEFAATDTVSISPEARALAAEYATMSKYPLTKSGTLLAPIDRYLSTARSDLTALNHSRKNIGARIDSIIRSLGVKLGRDEKFALTVGGKNQIKVTGLKDKARVEQIEKALNADPTLGTEMRQLAVAGKLGEYAKAKENYAEDFPDFSKAIGQDIDAAFTSPGMRSFVIDQYLMDNAGVSLSDLAVERGADGTVSLSGQTSELSALLAEDPTLGTTITDIIDKGEVNSSFSATFEFANGAISDSTTTEEAKKKIEKVEIRLLGGVDPDTGEAFEGMLPTELKNIQNNAGDADPALARAMSRGFTLRAASNGEFEITGLDDLSPRYKQMLEGLVQIALNGAADQPGATNSFADVADAYIEQHQFEHGDTLEYAHMVEITIGGGSQSTKVVSPDADKAQDEANQKTAGELGKKLKGMMADDGIDTTGMEMEVDDSGKITVTAGVSEEEIAKAQAFVDQFVQKTKSEGAEAQKEAKEKDADAAEELKEEELRREVEAGVTDPAVGTPPTGFAARDVAAASDSADAQRSAWRDDLTEKVRHLLPDPKLIDEKSRIILETFLSWQEYMPGNHEEPNLNNAAKFETSALPGPVFGGRADPEYESDAARLYHDLLGGMKNFHDERKNVRYSLESV